jgi:hypothetical protein
MQNTAATQTVASQKQPRQRKTPPEASREEYFQLFREVLGPRDKNGNALDLPRDIFLDACVTYVGKIWEPADNYIDRIKSEAHNLELCGIRKYSYSLIKSHFVEYTNRQTAGLVCVPPDWDGIDRIAQIADCLTLDGSQNLDKRGAEQFLKGWVSGILRKIYKPSHQNPVLILKGPQGIGKDALLNVLCGGYGQWSKNMTLSNNDKDNYLQLSHAAVLRISEFERSARRDVATLKDMIFRETSYVREAYGAKARDLQCRASFAATSNIDDIFTDSSGNRRYWILNLKAIRFQYPNTPADARQILAQAWALAEDKFTVPPMYLHSMNEYIASKTPDSIDDFVAEQYESIIGEWLSEPIQAPRNGPIRTAGYITKKEFRDAGLYKKLLDATGLRPHNLTQRMKQLGYDDRFDSARIWNLPPVFILSEPISLPKTVPSQKADTNDADDDLLI